MNIKLARLQQIKLIHVAKRELGIDEETYRSMLTSIPELKGETSIKGLSVINLKVIVETLKSKGFKVKRSHKTKGKPHNFKSMPSSINKIEALLTDMKLPWSYADSIANRMFGIQRCAWVREPKQFKALISALNAKAKKNK